MNEEGFSVRCVCRSGPRFAGLAGHGANQRDHGRHFHHHDRSCRGARHSRTQLARLRAEGNRRRADQDHHARRRRRSDHGDHQHAALRHRVQGRHHHGLLDDAFDGRGRNRCERGGHSAYRPRAVPDQRGAHQVVGRHAAADPDHGQGAVRAHEGARHQDRRLYRLLRFLRRSLVQRLQGPGYSDGNDARHRGAFCAPGYVGRRTGAEARSPPIRTRSWSAPPAPPRRCRRPRCASAATRA